MDELLELIRQKVFAEMDMTRDMSDDEIRELIHSVISQEAKQQSISIKERIRLEEQTYNSLRKLDILQELVENDDITEIMVNGPSHIFYE